MTHELKYLLIRELRTRRFPSSMRMCYVHHTHPLDDSCNMGWPEAELGSIQRAALAAESSPKLATKKNEIFAFAMTEDAWLTLSTFVHVEKRLVEEKCMEERVAKENCVLMAKVLHDSYGTPRHDAIRSEIIGMVIDAKNKGVE